MEEYVRARALLVEASEIMDGIGDTLIAAHIATPIALLDTRLDPREDTDT